jgi:hypothetical protein
MQTENRLVNPIREIFFKVTQRAPVAPVQADSFSELMPLNERCLSIAFVHVGFRNI